MSLRDLDYLLWHVRFTVLVQQLHWRAAHQGAWTVQPSAPVSLQNAAALEHYERYQGNLQT
jgi:hypothetical protein